jgi:NAD(P)H-hydrate epimerase
VTSFPSAPLTDVPAVTAGQMRELDRLAEEDFGISLAQMMELAGSGLARLAAEAMDGVAGKRVTVLAGPGNNGGGGLVAARHLANRGTQVHVVLAQPVGRLHVAARERLLTLIEMDVSCCVAAWDLAPGELETLLASSDLLIDALLGYSAEGPPRGPIRDLLERAAGSAARVLSLDLPSGLDPDTGDVDGIAMRAAATMAVALPKRGQLTASGRRQSGDLYLADIGLPAALYARAGLHFADPFLAGPFVRLD